MTCTRTNLRERAPRVTPWRRRRSARQRARGGTGARAGIGARAGVGAGAGTYASTLIAS